jgi:hypothetical protein
VDCERRQGPKKEKSKKSLISCSGEQNLGPDIEAMDWKTARFTAIIPTRVGSEKWAASRGDGPCLWALYAS